MPPKKTPKECNCGPLKPKKNDQNLDGMEPTQVLGKIQLLCDDNTGVFLFRYNQGLFLRVVEVD